MKLTKYFINTLLKMRQVVDIGEERVSNDFKVGSPASIGRWFQTVCLYDMPVQNM